MTEDDGRKTTASPPGRLAIRLSSFAVGLSDEEPDDRQQTGRRWSCRLGCSRAAAQSQDVRNDFKAKHKPTRKDAANKQDGDKADDHDSATAARWRGRLIIVSIARGLGVGIGGFGVFFGRRGDRRRGGERGLHVSSTTAAELLAFTDLTTTVRASDQGRLLSGLLALDSRFRIAALIQIYLPVAVLAESGGRADREVATRRAPRVSATGSTWSIRST